MLTIDELNKRIEEIDDLQHQFDVEWAKRKWYKPWIYKRCIRLHNQAHALLKVLAQGVDNLPMPPMFECELCGKLYYDKSNRDDCLMEHYIREDY